VASINSKTYETSTPRKVAFIGLGVMGLPMAGHLAKAGHQVTVYNRNAQKAQAWVKEFGGRACATPREAASGAEIVFSCVGNDDDLRSVFTHDGILIRTVIVNNMRSMPLLDQNESNTFTKEDLHGKKFEKPQSTNKRDG